MIVDKIRVIADEIRVIADKIRVIVNKIRVIDDEIRVIVNKIRVIDNRIRVIDDSALLASNSGRTDERNCGGKRRISFVDKRALVRADSTPPAEIRDLVAYADAYVTLADELEAEAHFLRYSTTAARNLAGTEALTTYSLAQRLSRQKRYAHLKPHVADMRRALGKQRKPKPEEVARKAAERAVKAAAKVARTAPEPEVQ